MGFYLILDANGNTIMGRFDIEGDDGIVFFAIPWTFNGQHHCGRSVWRCTEHPDGSYELGRLVGANRRGSFVRA